MNGVNLIPAFRIETSARRARVRVWASVLVAAAIVNVLGAAVFRSLWSLDAGPVRAQIAAARETVAASDANHLKVRGEISRLLQASLASKLVGEHPDWSLLLRAINQARGEGVALEQFELHNVPPPAPAPVAAGETKPSTAPRATERYTLKLKGIATELAKVMTFVDRLEKLGVMESVTMKQSRADATRGVTITGFDIECALAERPTTDAQPPTTPATADASSKGERP